MAERAEEASGAPAQLVHDHDPEDSLDLAPAEGQPPMPDLKKPADIVAFFDTNVFSKPPIGARLKALFPAFLPVPERAAVSCYECTDGHDSFSLLRGALIADLARCARDEQQRRQLLAHPRSSSREARCFPGSS